MINFIFVDLLYTERWQPRLFYGEDYLDVDNEGLNCYFEENDYQSKYIFKNMGSTTVYFGAYLAAWVLLGILWLFKGFSL